MRVVVVEHHSGGARREFAGREQDVAKDLLHAYPFLLTKFGPHASADLLVKALDRNQAYSATEKDADLFFKAERHHVGVDNPLVGDMMGGWHRFQPLFDAAAFLAGRPEVMPPRQALLDADEDVEAAALMAYGLEPDESTREALRAALAASQGPLTKSADLQLPKQAVAATPDGEKFAAAVQRALAHDDAFPVTLGGKHSAGSILVLDNETDERFLLKPGAGKNSPAAGVREEAASQAKREAGAYAAAVVMGLEDVVPECHLLLLDGREYAAIRLLPFTFKSAIDLRATDPSGPRRLFHLYLGNGQLHQWAAFDFIIGQTDRHAGNVMIRGDQVYLIDSGSAFAGPDFAPATDRYTFVPYYLRAMAPADFTRMTDEEKMHALPRLSGSLIEGFGKWLGGIDSAALEAALHRHGIDPAPVLERLCSLQSAASHTPADLAVNAAWVLP